MKNQEKILLNVGSELFNKLGYEKSSIKLITEAANMPKGSFFYYYKSKELFAIEVINIHSQKIFQALNSVISYERKDKLNNFEKTLNTLSTDFIFITKMISELGRQDFFSNPLILVNQQIKSLFKSIFKDLQYRNLIDQKTDINSISENLFTLINGLNIKMILESKRINYNIDELKYQNKDRVE